MKLLIALFTLHCSSVFCYTGYFWHLTDVHWDPTYWTTRESCNEGAMHKPLGMLGDYECDAPWQLLSSTIKAMQSFRPNPDFIIWTGDNTHHPKDKANLSVNLTVSLTVNISRQLKEAFPNVSIYFCIGNHDYYPVNDLPVGENAIYRQLAEEWRELFAQDPSQETLFRRGAHYTFLVQDNLRIVSMNTNFYYRNNKVTREMDDPADQFKWFDDLMNESRRKGEKVYLLTHIPPGHTGVFGEISWMNPAHNRRLVDLIVKHADVIVASFTAHQHADTFRLFYESGTPVGYMLLAPSLTPWRARIGGGRLTSAHNPALRLVKYDRHDLGLLDVVQYYLDLGQNKTTPAVWKQEYSFTHAYDIPNITALNLHNLVDTFKREDRTLFSKYVRYHTVSTNHTSVTSCDDVCKHLLICAITHVRYPEFSKCKKAVTSGCVSSPRALRLPLVITLLLTIYHLKKC